MTGNILGAALPMLVAQILNLLYNIVDRIYIARIPEVGTAALGAVGLCFPLIVVITAFANLTVVTLRHMHNKAASFSWPSVFSLPGLCW